ncbi:hypothetical protein ATCC90586_001615 [Pythium insidiosum]|nr:hypothetical protein ATCC90586_001615 [Pythium insidiosum]
MTKASSSRKPTPMQVNVVVRVRPRLPHERLQPMALTTTKTGHNKGKGTLLSVAGEQDAPAEEFLFDRCYEEATPQRLLFQREIQPALAKVLDGINTTVFAYGATGTGKTFTMEGNKRNLGMIPRSVKRLFEVAAESQRFCQLDMSYLEIYNDRVLDLLVGKAQQTDLPIRQQPDGTIAVQGLSRKRIATLQEFEQLYERGSASRQRAPTELNAESSRSHSILMIQALTRDNKGGEFRCGKLHLIDLAGSEDNRRTGNTGARLTESGKINMSLFVLGKVIMALNKGDVQRIPFRDSKLTRLLQDSLGGSSHAVMICNVAPTRGMYQETLHTLSYASKAKGIVNHVAVNRTPVETKASKASSVKTTAAATSKAAAPKPASTSTPSSTRLVKATSRQSIAGTAPCVAKRAVSPPQRSASVMESKLSAWKQSRQSVSPTAPSIGVKRAVSATSTKPSLSTSAPRPLTSRMSLAGAAVGPSRVPLAKKPRLSLVPTSNASATKLTAGTGVSRSSSINKPQAAPSLPKKTQAFSRLGCPADDKENAPVNGNTVQPTATAAAVNAVKDLTPVELAKKLIGVAIDLEKKKRYTTAYCVFKRAYHVLPEENPKLAERLQALEAECPHAPQVAPSQQMSTAVYMQLVLEMDLLEVLNVGTTQELTELHSIGDKRADKIIETRPFSQLSDLLRVPGITDKIVQKLHAQHIECTYIDRSVMAASWNLSQAEAARAQQRALEDEEQQRLLAAQPTRWRDVRTERSFLERSRRRRPGAVRAAERYLRDDIHCGIAPCAPCDAVARRFRPARCLPRDGVEYVVPDAFSLLQCMELMEDQEAFARGVPHVLVLETVLQEALRIAPSRDATRLKGFFRDDTRRAVERCCVQLFPDQHHVATAVDALVVDSPGHADSALASVQLETQAARDERAVVKALSWYATQGHVAPSSRLVWVTEAPDSTLSALLRVSLEIEVLTCEQLVRSRLRASPFLLELAANTAAAIRWWRDESAESGRGEFAPHWPLPQLRDAVARGDALQGKLDVSAHHPMEAFVAVDRRASPRGAAPERVLVLGRDAMNRGVHGDTVVVQLLPREHWRAPRSDRQLVHYASEETPGAKPPGDDDDVGKGNGNREGEGEGEGDGDEQQQRVPTGVVVGVLQRASQFIVATVLASTVAPGDDVALAIPMDVRLPKIRIRSQRMDALLDRRLKVVIDHWAFDSLYPSGHYTAVLGAAGELATELSAILVRHDIDEAPFCEAALACLPDLGLDVARLALAECSTAKRPETAALVDWRVPDAEAARRRDLRGSHRVFSVDPPGCQDIDDAMSVRRLPNGNVELGVHIADVSFFVEHASALDREGRQRGTTVYLVGQRLDMLPALLSADLCSLHERVDRLAMSVLWELDGETLELVADRTWFGRTVIRSCASMTYEQAHRLVQGMSADKAEPVASSRGAAASPPRRGVAGGPVPLPLQHELREDLQLLTRISRKLAKARGEDGGIDLSRSETFSLNVSELGEGVEIVMKESLEIHATIAELMILANASVARKIVTALPATALLRRHPPPSGPRFTQLIKMAQAKDIAIDASNNYTLQQSLVHAERSGRADAKTMALLKSLAVRVMSEAEYVCASAASAETDENGDATSFAHYGLGLQYYTHFTSPIRRYADVIVHRQLLDALAMEAAGRDRQLLRAAGGSSPRSHASAGVALPPSLVPSVLADDDGDAFLDGLVADVDSKLVIEVAETSEAADEPPLRFPPSELVPLTEHLNRKNRNAKLASRSCEELFLALYFSTHTVRTHAIITSLKQNGFLVYVPTYDLRAPVYVRDRDGVVQMDPLLCGVRIVDTSPPTGAFAGADCIRMIPQARVELDASAERLDVVVAPRGAEPSVACAFKLLDEIEVQISCDLAGSNARVPQLQLLLVGRVKPSKRPGRRDVTVTTHSEKPKTSILEMQRIAQSRSEAAAAAATSPHRRSDGATSASRSMYDLLVAGSFIAPPKNKLLTRPALLNERQEGKQSGDRATKSTPAMRRRGPGRLIFGDYEPPATQHYQQKLASYMDKRSEELEEELSINRSGAAAGVAGTDMKRLERDALTRTMKLAAEKRHDRINRRNKTG